MDDTSFDRVTGFTSEYASAERNIADNRGTEECYFVCDFFLAPPQDFSATHC